MPKKKKQIQIQLQLQKHFTGCRKYKTEKNKKSIKQAEISEDGVKQKGCYYDLLSLSKV